MKKIYLICNLHSGKTIINFPLSKIIDMFTKADFEVTVHPTQFRGDASISAKYACESEFDLIVCCGGDGTLNEVISGCIKAHDPLPIGYIPTGSTNDFARSLGIPKNAMDAVDAIINGKAEKCDIGKIGDRYFTYIAAFGALTEVSYQTAQPVKNVLGYAAYILNGMVNLHKIKASRMNIEYDGNVIEDEFIFGMITNSTSVAKLLSMPDMKKDDGLFEVTLIRKPRNIVDLQHIITGLTNFQLGTEKEYFDHFHSSKLRITCLEEEPVPWTVDGEFGGKNNVNLIQNLHKALEFILPVS